MCIRDRNYRRNFRKWKNIQENRFKEQMIPIYMFFFLGEENSSNDVGRNTDVYKRQVIGNAVPPLLAHSIAEEIINQVFKGEI